jgi:hypothetical protein
MSAEACAHCGSTAEAVRGHCPECGTARETRPTAPLIPQPVAAALAAAVIVALVVLAATGHVAIAGLGVVFLLLLVLALFGGGLW